MIYEFYLPVCYLPISFIFIDSMLKMFYMGNILQPYYADIWFNGWVSFMDSDVFRSTRVHIICFYDQSLCMSSKKKHEDIIFNNVRTHHS